MSEHIIKLSDRKIDFVVNRLNKVLEEERILGATWNKQVLKAFILDNMYSIEDLAILIIELNEAKEHNIQLNKNK